MSQQVEITRTRQSPAEAESVLRAAWGDVFVGPLRPDVLRLVLALWDLETGSGGSEFNFNWGNMVDAGQTGRFYVADDTGHTRHFAAFASQREGADALLRQLTRDSRSEWRAGLATGDPELFVRHLSGEFGGPAYFEASPARYLATYLERWDKYPHLNAPARTPEAPAPKTPPATMRRKTSTGAAVVVLACGGLLWVLATMTR